jgi:hypothetical protein
MNTKALTIWFLLGAISLTACAPAASPTVEVASIPSSTEATVSTDETGFYPLSTRIGIADVDVVLAALESNDPQTLRDLFLFTQTSCTTADGLGGPPKCRKGEADGAQVEVLPFLGPEGSFLHKDEIEEFPGLDVTGLYAVYRVAESAYSDENYPAGEYGVILAADENKPSIILQVRHGGIVRIDYLLGSSLNDLKAVLDRDASEIVISP